MTKLKGIAAALLTLALVATGGGVLAQQEKENPGSNFAARKAQLGLFLPQKDDANTPNGSRTRTVPAPKVRPDVEIEMLLRAAREQEQAGNFDQALALTARMETALHEWRTKLNPPTRMTDEAPQNYIKRLDVLPGEEAGANAAPPRKPDQPDDPFGGNLSEGGNRQGEGGNRQGEGGNRQGEGGNRQGPASNQDSQAKILQDVYTLYQPYKPQNNANPGQKDATSWARGVTIPTPVFDRTTGARRQMLSLADVERAAVPFPETKAIDQPAAKGLFGGREEKPKPRTEPKFTKALIAEKLDRKVTFHAAGPAGLIEIVKLIQTSTDGPGGVVPIFFDLNELRKANVDLNKKVVFDVHDAPLGSALKMVLDQVGLAYQVEDGGIVIVAPGADPTAPLKP